MEAQRTGRGHRGRPGPPRRRRRSRHDASGKLGLYEQRPGAAVIEPAFVNLLRDIRDYAAEAVETVGDRSAEDILSERMREHSVLRTTQIVGEASAQLLKLQPEGFPGVELREATRFRNILVHGYGKIRMDSVVAIVRDDLPRLIAAVDALLSETHP
ncbi:MAG: DUF86 domain-containing protein [Brevundimonas sp.]|nr:MAG: DUF86 domain-containing protein [Brevundimonas sp.]